LQQELALVKAEMTKKVEERPKTGIDSLGEYVFPYLCPAANASFPFLGLVGCCI
jgi:hypothetical protein